MSGIFCGASFSSAAEAATSSVAADDKKRVALDVKGRLPVNAKVFAIFCPQRNIMTEVVENFMGETSFSKLLLYKIQLFWPSLIFVTMIGMDEKDILDYPFGMCLDEAWCRNVWIVSSVVVPLSIVRYV